MMKENTTQVRNNLKIITSTSFVNKSWLPSSSTSLMLTMYPIMFVENRAKKLRSETNIYDRQSSKGKNVFFFFPWKTIMAHTAQNIGIIYSESKNFLINKLESKSGYSPIAAVVRTIDIGYHKKWHIQKIVDHLTRSQRSNDLEISYHINNPFLKKWPKLWNMKLFNSTMYHWPLQKNKEKKRHIGSHRNKL